MKTEEQIKHRREYEHQWYLNRSGKGGGKDRKRHPLKVEVRCAECGKKMLLQPNQIKNRQHSFCDHECYGKWCSENRRAERSLQWKGGRRQNDSGYMEIRLQPDDLFYSMMSIRHYVLEHRLVMAKHLNRCLLPWEVVHHINGIKNDNHLENLKLLGNNGSHNTMLDKWCKKLQRENLQLKQRITELELQGG